MKVRKAVIPAAGLGTRFLPATKAMPKEMLPIVDKPTIQYIIKEAIASGIEEILIIKGKSKMSIKNHFNRSFKLGYELKKTIVSSFWRLLELFQDQHMCIILDNMKPGQGAGPPSTVLGSLWAMNFLLFC